MEILTLFGSLISKALERMVNEKLEKNLRK
jgi:hypothetical protein